ncbi:MAG TPA: permease-like cell division protein FtsX [Candidatus Saccharimonadales bacterium]|nr:permease-like cell division protein FtsX [Candidatus Saccharimonadales bacterium]
MRRKLRTFWRVVHTGIVNFIRNATLAIAAMAVMVITLTIVLFSLITNATFANTIQQITDKIDISVFLNDNVSDTQGKQLAGQLEKLSNVKSVTYLNKQQALTAYIKQNANNQDLVAAATEAGNPIPATIRIKPRDLNQIQQIKEFLTKKDVAALQTTGSPSYSGDRKKAIDNITHATNILREIGVVAIIIFALVSALIIFNTIQMAIFNRRDEITIMRLLGASTWYIRGPFVVESAVYGFLSAIISVLIVNSAFVASSTALQASSLGLLDINYASQYFGDNFWKLLGLQLAIGIIIGGLSAVIATRRYLKFKTR